VVPSEDVQLALQAIEAAALRTIDAFGARELSRPCISWPKRDTALGPVSCVELQRGMPVIPTPMQNLLLFVQMLHRLLFITTVPNTKLCAWGEEDSGGHVL
jgi:hypothetical protein